MTTPQTVALVVLLLAIGVGLWSAYRVGRLAGRALTRTEIYDLTHQARREFLDALERLAKETRP